MNTLFHEVTGQGPDLVLLHGWGMHSGIWTDLIPVLSQHFTVHVFDLPGHGKSPRLDDYYFSNWLDILEQNLPESAIVVGWSLGGLLAMYFARFYPERVTHLITIGSSAYFVRDDNWPGMRFDAMHEFHDQVVADPEKTLKQFFQLQLLNVENNRSLAKHVGDIIFSEPIADPIALEAGLDLLLNVDLRAEMPLITQPSLHIYGRLDTIAPVALSDSMRVLAPHHHFKVFPNAAHMPFLSDQSEFITLLIDFYHEND